MPGTNKHKNSHRVVLTIDVEDWFCVRNMQSSISSDQWDGCEQRIHNGLDFILAELAKRQITATFFVLGWICDRHPDVVKKIAASGHEIESHGYSHKAIDELTPHEFDLELKRSCRQLLALTGQRVKGFRAPSFSITDKTLWALDVLRDNGFSYDSSIFPIRHPNYGIPSFPQRVHEVNGIIEVPMNRVDVAGFPVPISGGGYFRLYPYGITRRLIRHALKERDVVLYFHPWEFDADQPRNREMSFFKRFRHYTGLKGNRRKFTRLLDDFEFASMGKMLNQKGFDIARREC